MKKIISLVLALVMALGCTLALTSCGDEPELDFNVAKTNLEAKGYNVQITDNEDILGETFVGAKKMLMAYEVMDGLSDVIDPDSYEPSLIIIEFDLDETAELYLELIEAESKREKEYSEFEIEKYEHILEEYSGVLKSDEIDRYNDKIKDLKEELAELETMTYGCSGSFVWSGYKTAAAASRGE